MSCRDAWGTLHAKCGTNQYTQQSRIVGSEDAFVILLYLIVDPTSSTVVDSPSEISCARRMISSLFEVQMISYSALAREEDTENNF